MKTISRGLGKLASFKVVGIYALVSVLYIYTSDYFLSVFTSDVLILSRLQTYKGIFFILITSALLYFLIKGNISIVTSYYQRIIGLREISDRKLTNSKEQYLSLFNNSPLPTWLFDPVSLKFLLVNDAACEVYGFSREEFLTMTIRDIRPASEMKELETALSSSLDYNRYNFPTVFKHRKKSGALIHVKIRVAFVTFNGSQVRLASVTDISPEMQIQAELMEMNARLNLASEIAGLGYWTNDLIGNAIQWSDELYKIFELDPKRFELTLENIMAHFHQEDRMDFDSDLAAAFEANKIKETERRIITGSGKLKWILERQYLTKNENGVLVKLEGVVLDITRRKLQEQNIRESNERFKMLTKATVEAIIDWDIQNNEVMWGEGFQTMLGYDLRENDFNLWSKNIHADDRKRVLSELSKTMSDPTKQYFNAEFRFLKANGDITYVQHRGIFIRDAKGRAIRALGAMIDLTEALDKIRKIESQDRALKEIAWTQSHVVRAPLANLMGLISLLKNKGNLGMSDEVLLGYISDSAEKLDNVIREIVGKTVVTEQKEDAFE